MSGGVKIPVSAEFEGSDIDKVVQQLTQQMNRLAGAVANANKVKFNPVDKGSINELKQIQARFEELQKISSGLRNRIKATGQSGTAFQSLDWSRLYEDQSARARAMSRVYSHVTGGTAFALGSTLPSPAGVPPHQTPPRSGSGGGAGNSSRGGGSGNKGSGGFQSTIGGVASAGLRAAGPVGGVVEKAGAAGLSGGMGAGLMGLFGGLAALAVGKVVGGIMSKVDAAEQEAIGYDTLKRTLGDVNVSFNMLRESMRSAADSIDITFTESLKMGSEFAKVANISKEQYKTIAEEVSIGGGFGRSMGIDPSQSNQFFAQMRQFQVTGNANDSRKLALMIGESVAKANSFSKSDEFLQAIASFTSGQSRSGLAGANVEGYAGMLSGLVGSRIPGLDPTGSAAILGRVNATIANGGGAGEAGNNYMFSALGKPLGLDPVQVSLLQQQGAFGTGKGTFGNGTLFSEFSRKFGGGVSGSASNDTEQTLPRLLKRLQQDYASNPSLMLNASSRLLGVNESQAMALHSIAPERLGGTFNRLQRNGVDIKSLSATGISALSNIEAGSPATLAAQASSLQKLSGRNALSPDERAKLNSAMASGNSETMKDVLVQLTATREQERTQGSEVREAINDADKTLQRLATGLIDPMKDMRNAMVFLAGGGKMGANGINEAVMRIDAKDRIANNSARVGSDQDTQRDIIRKNLDAATATREDFRKRILNGNMTPEQQEAARLELAKKLGELDKERVTAQEKILSLQKERSVFEKTESDKLEADVKAMQVAAAGGTPATSSTPAAATVLGAGAKAQGVGKGATPDRLAALAAADRELGLTPGTSAALFQTESSFDGTKVSKAGARGFGQIMPRELGVMERHFGRKMNPEDFNDSLSMYKSMMKENMAHFGGDQTLALRGYQGGWNKNNWGAENSSYVPQIDANRGNFSTPMPDGASSKTGLPSISTVQVEGKFTLDGKDGQSAADPVIINKKVGVPAASGTARAGQ